LPQDKTAIGGKSSASRNLILTSPNSHYNHANRNYSQYQAYAIKIVMDSVVTTHPIPFHFNIGARGGYRSRTIVFLVKEY